MTSITALILIIGILAVLVVLPSIVFLCAKLAAYGTLVGKEFYEDQRHAPKTKETKSISRAETR